MFLSRRRFLIGMGSAGTALAMPSISRANAAANAYFDGFTEDNGFRYRRTNFDKIDSAWQRQMVKYFSDEPPGSVVVDTRNHFLYVTWENNTALRYGVGVGREGFKWYGRARIDRKALWPRWVPPPEMLKRQPDLPRRVEGGAANNPLGPRALYLYRDGADTGYRLHGTLEPWSIGRDVSSGCIRMFPEDIIDLYQRCPKGTRVLVLEHLGSSAG
ncbi:lipoprotein-anchoring transpeptidase ErfK/SrfK [Roseibium hamelinense]|uniref:Lipoprotein-anchoring transpeptidase ErfK/SrfK n=1 Tax=Roseibium hamelinense TaxID=150831 RepID=A0A562SME9_9HYPH|nr:L,D-transpeptidase [Roseibium hamelinense]MTI45079.1 L,D-transpeptidase [Roseibium hamelinense]TWI82343.1 lipoprotein-anchoring transpeptidase ErfK/SrfK [Roseibium hamelinense]